MAIAIELENFSTWVGILKRVLTTNEESALKVLPKKTEKQKEKEIKTEKAC